MKNRRALYVLIVMALLPLAGISQSYNSGNDYVVSQNAPGLRGGNLVVSLRSEPKTLNPAVSNDLTSREVISQMSADLIHINRYSQKSESALAKSWNLSSDGLQYDLHLRRGLKFSDGVPFDADDVVFSFKIYLDPKINAPQRDSLIIGGQPVTVQKLDSNAVRFRLAKPYASAERLFDSVAILPRHLLEGSYLKGTLTQEWNLSTAPDRIAGLGAFRLKEYVPGQHITLERNPYYWKIDRGGSQLPYLSTITFLFVANEDAEVLRFRAGDTDILNRLGADNYTVLKRDEAARKLQVYDVGPGLEYNFLLFNMNAQLPSGSSDLANKQRWFQDVQFRRAISLAIDRDAMNRIVLLGRGSPIWTHVTPGNQLWFDNVIPHEPRSLNRSRELLRASGFSWGKDGLLMDSRGTPVSFSIIVSTSSMQRTKMAAMIQQDVKDLGINVQIVPIEFRAMLDRIFHTHNYEAAVMGLGGGDLDPNSQLNIWMSSGDDHLWNLGESHPATAWEAEIDSLMQKQMSTFNPAERRRLYNRVQQIETEQIPMVFLVAPNLLVAKSERLHNFQPAVLDSHTLWNADELYVDQDKRTAK
jgi:peptide/nickel transport system substrate-binding protein